MQWNTYKFDGPTSQSARWTELSSTEWADKLPRCDMPVWLKVNAAGRNPAKSDSDYLQIKEWSVTTERQDDEECTIGGLESGGLGTRWVRAYYPLGRFFSNGIDGAIQVEQSHLGSLNILDMSWGGDGGSIAPLSGDDS